MTTYRQFIAQRDKALEKILLNSKRRITQYVNESFSNIESFIIHHYSRINDENRFTSNANSVLDLIDGHIKGSLVILAETLAIEIYRTNLAVKTLTKTAEAEALSRHLDKNHIVVKQPNSKQDIQEVKAKCLIVLEKYRSKLSQEVQRARVNGDGVPDLAKRIASCFPKKERYSVKVLTPIKHLQADFMSSGYKSYSMDTIDDDMWAYIVREYKNEYIPESRYAKSGSHYAKSDELYTWEIEQMQTDDFVSQVRDGMVEAANDAGVTDFMWIAVLDNRTREEHRLKDGLTSSEIEEKLKDEWSDFEDQSTVAPGGFNCRCRSVPYIKDIDDKLKGEGSFDKWLES